MLDWLLHVLPIAALFIAYFVRIEIRLARLINDVSWIKGALGNIQCQKNPSKEPTAGEPLEYASIEYE